MAERAQKESLSDEGRENYACHNYEDDADAGVDVVRERSAPIKKRKQNDVGTEE